MRLGRLIVTGCCSASLALGVGAASLAAPSPQPAATPSYAERVLQPLREIGHVKAHTPFCSAFLRDASPGVDSALAYEQTLLDTVQDFRATRLTDPLAKEKSLRRLEADLAKLRDLANSGRAELAALDELANTSNDERHEAVVAFRDALDGAKARQMMLAKKLANVYGELAERPVATLVNLPGDGDIDFAQLFPNANSPFTASAAPPSGLDINGNPSQNFLDSGNDTAELQLEKDLFNAIPGDEMVGRDLARAGTAGTRVLALGGC